MGLTHIEMEIANVAEPSRTAKLRFLVDSVAIRTVVPRQVLNDLGIEPIASDAYAPANGERMTRSRGVALFRYGERVAGADVIFGEEGDHNLLGVLTLEALALGLNPLRREFFEIPLTLT